jgi:hypothetical protein
MWSCLYLLQLLQPASIPRCAGPGCDVSPARQYKSVNNTMWACKDARDVAIRSYRVQVLGATVEGPRQTLLDEPTPCRACSFSMILRIGFVEVDQNVPGHNCARRVVLADAHRRSNECCKQRPFPREAEDVRPVIQMVRRQVLPGATQAAET